MKLTFLLLLIFSGCASRQAAWDKTKTFSQMDEKQWYMLKKEAGMYWLKRDNKEELMHGLAIWEKMNNAKTDYDILVNLTRGYYLLADAHLEDIKEKKKMFAKAADFGEKALFTNENFKKTVKNGAEVEASLDLLTKKEVAAIYWQSAALGKWVSASGIAPALKYQTRIKAMIERVNQLQSDFFFAAVPRYWGGYYAVAPHFTGGDLKKSEKFFARSLKEAPHYLGTKVLRAELLWTKLGKKEKFRKELEEVLAADEKIVKELWPENILEKKKAQRLLEQENLLFK